MFVKNKIKNKKAAHFLQIKSNQLLSFPSQLHSNSPKLGSAAPFSAFAADDLFFPTHCGGRRRRTVDRRAAESGQPGAAPRRMGAGRIRDRPAV